MGGLFASVPTFPEVEAVSLPWGGSRHPHLLLCHLLSPHENPHPLLPQVLGTHFQTGSIPEWRTCVVSLGSLGRAAG